MSTHGSRAKDASKRMILIREQRWILLAGFRAMAAGDKTQFLGIYEAGKALRQIRDHHRRDIVEDTIKKFMGSAPAWIVSKLAFRFTHYNEAIARWSKASTKDNDEINEKF